jgi:hypothetical protein
MLGEFGTVEIESQWTARRRESLGITPRVVVREKDEKLRSTVGEMEEKLRRTSIEDTEEKPRPSKGS